MKKLFYLMPVCIILLIGFVSCEKDKGNGNENGTETPVVYHPFCKYQFTIGSNLLDYADIEVSITPLDTTMAVIVSRLEPTDSLTVMHKEFKGSFLPAFSKIEVKASLKPGVDTVGKRIPVNVSINYTASLVNSVSGASSGLVSHNNSNGITILGSSLANHLVSLSKRLSYQFRFDSKGGITYGVMTAE